MIRSVKDIPLKNRRVFLRVDLNVPLENGEIASEARIIAALPTIQYLLAQNTALLVVSHLGRPTEGVFDPALSLAPVAKRLGELLGRDVPLLPNWIDGVSLTPGQIALAENVRFLVGEKKNDSELAKKMAALCDVFVMDAFATAHRAESSTVGIARLVKEKCAGLLLEQELKALSVALENPKKPIVAVIGGSKVSTKLTILESLLKKVDVLVVGGGMANTFLAAQGHAVGQSLCEPDLIPEALRILEAAKAQGVEVFLPHDAWVKCEDNAAHIRKITDIGSGEAIYDIGPESACKLSGILLKAGTVIWNGPVGVFEQEAFAKGTQAVAEAIANSQSFSLVGGGDTIAAIEKFKVVDKISYISTAGGAFLEYLEGKTLPGIAALELN